MSPGGVLVKKGKSVTVIKSHLLHIYCGHVIPAFAFFSIDYYE